ncbi:MAG: hypothetical protein AABY22_30615 [Nanoarchaeota archaeon]
MSLPPLIAHIGHHLPSGFPCAYEFPRQPFIDELVQLPQIGFQPVCPLLFSLMRRLQVRVLGQFLAEVGSSIPRKQLSI